MLVLRALVLLLYIHGAAAQTCAPGQVAVSGTCTFYHMDPELIFWFKYNLDDRFSYNGGSLDSLKCFGNASAYRMPLTNTQGTISTFAKRGNYSIKSVVPTAFPPDGGMPAVVQTSLPLPWSNKAMTYTYWFHAQKVDNFFSMTFYDLTPTDGTVSMSWNDFNGDWMINWYDGSVTPNNGYTIFNYAMTTLSYKWTFFVIQLYEYDSSGKVAFDVYFNNTKIVTWNSNLILKTKFSIQVRTQSFFSSPSLQSANFPYSYVDKYGYIDDTRLYSKKLSSDYMAWLFNPCNSPLSLDEDSSLCRCPTGWVIQASSCVECGAGKIVDTVAQVCITCAAGTYSGGAGASACTSCPAGKSSSTVGASAASGCDIVLYATQLPVGTSAAQSFYMNNRPYAHYKAKNWAMIGTDPAYFNIRDVSGNNRDSIGTESTYFQKLNNSYGGRAAFPILRSTSVSTNARLRFSGVTRYFTMCAILRSRSPVIDELFETLSIPRFRIVYEDDDVFGGFRAFVSLKNCVDSPTCGLDNAWGLPGSGNDPIPIPFGKNDWVNVCVKNDFAVDINCPSVYINGVEATPWGGCQDIRNTGLNVYGPMSASNTMWNLGPGAATKLTAGFDFNQLVTWDRALNSSEMLLMHNTLMTYMLNGTDAFECAENLGTACTGSALVFVCNAGYTGPSGGPCAPCVAGTYKDQISTATCASCPAGTFSGATGASVCTSCPAGTYSNALGASGAGACTRCPGGTASSVAGASSLGSCSTCGSGLYSFGGASSCVAVQNLSCSGCPANTYYAGAVCAACGAGSVSVAGSAACECAAGFTNTSSGCQACPAGTYKRAAGTAACRSCQANSVSASGSALCACAAGYTGNTGEVCVACVAGKYKSVTGSAACVSCASRRNSPAAAPSITSCLCDAAYTQAENATWTTEAVYAQACVACAPGTFKALTGVQACTTCAQNQSSVAAMTVCSCVAGFTGPDGGPCAECARGTYKNWLGSQSCTGCPWQTNTAGTGMTLLVNCTCNTGYTGPNGIACVQCAAGTYKNVTGSASCSICPTRTMSSIASASIERCQCMPSFSGPDGGPCAQCPSGQYKNWPNSSCAPCGANSDSMDGSTLCKCNTGNTEVLGYKGITADNFEKYDLLQACGASEQERCKSLGCGTDAAIVSSYPGYGNNYFNDNDYTTMGGIPLSWDCRPGGWTVTALPIDFGREKIVTSVVVYFEFGWCQHTFSGPAYTVRVGNTYPGWSPDTNNELLCPASTPNCESSPKIYSNGYTFVKFTIDCGNTLRGRYFTINKQIVSWSSATMSPSEMQVMGFKESMTCASCAAGTYKNGTGTAACTTCPASSYEPDLGAVQVTNCSCNAGYEGADGGPCVACALGKYKATNGTAPCVACPADTYIDVSASAYCKACPEFTTSVNGSVLVTACRCVPGYTGDGGGATVFVNSSNLARTCGTNSNQACLSSQSTTRSGQESSAALDDNIETISHTENGGYQWLRIDFGKVVYVQSLKIVILRAHEVDFHRDIQVRVGNIDSYLSNHVCYAHAGSLITLGVGTSYWTRTLSCTTAQQGQYLYYVNQNYVTFAEFSPVGQLGMPGTPCFACGSGRYKPSIGASACSLCNVSTFSEAANATSVATCLACQGNSTSVVGSPSKMFCQCDVGFEHEGEVCQQCAPGTYNTQLGRMACSNCTVGLYSVIYQAAANETCLPCPAGQWSAEGSSVCEVCPANSAAPAAMGRVVDCACNVGYTGPGGGPCVQCEVGKYKNTTGAWACTTCPAYSSSALASVKVTNCSCNAGFTGPNGLPCTGCSPGTYKAVSGAWACDSCAENTYSDGVGYTACRACVSTSVSATGSTSVWNCTCNAGYTGPTYLAVQGSANFARSCGSGGQACATAQSSTFMSFTAELAVDGTALTQTNTQFNSSQWWRVDFGRRVTVTSVSIFFSQHTTDALVVSVGDSATAGANSVCARVNFYGTADDSKKVKCSAATTGRYLHVSNTATSMLGMREIQAVGTEIVTLVWPGYCNGCEPGFFKPATSNEQCTPCPANTFSTATAARYAATCVPCIPNAVSASASVACACDVGFSAEGAACVACALGKYKRDVGPTACTVCPANSVNLTNSSEGCACAAGAEASY